jgi:SAM-dependent methyltransferase
VPDAIFDDPLLAQIYDAFEGERSDLDVYVDLILGWGARRVVDIGCGTGVLAVLLATHDVRVTGLDPSAAVLDVARARDTRGRVTWVHGDATALPPDQIDVAIMTGNVAQVFLSDAELTATLRCARSVLTADGHLVFEVRRPERRIWDEWAHDTDPSFRDVPGVGVVERRLSVTDVSLPFVSFQYTFRFAVPDVTITSASTLRFRSRDDVEACLTAAGFITREVREAPDRPGCEYVFVAQPAG